MSNANIALVQSLYAAFGRGDIATIIKALAAEATWESVGRPSDFPTLGLRQGPAAVQQFFELVGHHLDFSEFSPKEFFAADDRVFVLGYYAMAVKKTGSKIDSDWVHIFTVRDGQVVAFREFTDTAKVAEAYRG
jgi:ketosteroid isomerase-like protein